MPEYEVNSIFPGLTAVYTVDDRVCIGVVIPAPEFIKEYKYTFFSFDTSLCYHGNTPKEAVDAYMIREYA